jgi:A/G-specific adenine glycosylase
MENISKNLLEWFEGNARDLPWRKDRSPYYIWISEVMLQQTQVKQVVPYYTKFIEHFPDIFALAAAPSQQVLKIWQGMGYYTRARNLHNAAKIIVDTYDGRMPEDRTALIKLPGFGPYITHAVLSLAFNQPFAVMDGNVIRVVSRLMGLKQDVRLSGTKNMIQQEVDQILDDEMPGVFNEAIMELGATVCLPVNPKCDVCPLIDDCFAHARQQTEQIPFKSARKKRPVLKALTLICTYHDKLLLVKRPDNGFLGGLWEFPTYLDDENRSQSTYGWIKKEKFSMSLKKPQKTWSRIAHSYTHFQVQFFPNWHPVEKNHFKSEFYLDFQWIRKDDISGYPLHKGTEKIIEVILKDLEIITQGKIKYTVF